jgi:chitinase
MLVSMGGKVDSKDGTNKYSKLVSSSANIAAFSSKVLTFLSKYGFDGLDVNWQYPSSPADQWVSIISSRPFAVLLILEDIY